MPIVTARFAPIAKGGNGASLRLVLEARRAGVTLASTPPTEVTDLPPGCDLSRPPRAVAEEVFDGQQRDLGVLEILAHGPFRVHDFVRVGIRTGQEMTLHCLAIDADGSANVLMPSPGTETNHKPRGDWTYRESFDGEPVQFSTPGRTLFGCIGVPGPPRADLRHLWLDGWCEAADGTTISRTLDKDELRVLLDKTRQAPGVVAAYTWLEVSGTPVRAAETALARCARPVRP